MLFYRYDVTEQSAGLDMFGDPMSKLVPNPKIRLSIFNLHKETPKGYWIGYGHRNNGYSKGDSRWVSKIAKKRYAYPTKEEALYNFIRRKERQLKILKYNAWLTEIALHDAINIEEKQLKYIKGTPVLLPFDEEGEIVEFIDLLWGSKCVVRITKSNGFNQVGEKVDFLLKDIEINVE